MKILYITRGDHVDYQDDCLLIGLKELYGADVVDYKKREHNYESFAGYPEAWQLYGMGMTVTKVLPDLDVDRTDIENKIKNNFFDLVVYGSVWRSTDFLNEVLQSYPKNKIIFVDGEDHGQINDVINLNTPYFKRELTIKLNGLYPISFAMPTNRGIFTKDKKQNFSFITPLNQDTYIYKNEENYYKDYQQSRFGVTIRKAGWDCLRHYEILGNGCIPHFIDIENCPEQTLTLFPKQLCREVNHSFGTLTYEQVYDKYIQKFEQHFIEKNTTQALARYFLSTVHNLTL